MISVVTTQSCGDDEILRQLLVDEQLNVLSCNRVSRNRLVSRVSSPRRTVAMT